MPPDQWLTRAAGRPTDRRDAQFHWCAIQGIRAQGTEGDPGEMGPVVVHALSQGFSVATHWSLLAAGGFLAIGFIGATRVLVAAQREDTELQPDQT